MSVYLINPLTDDRWPEFVDRRPQAAVFHTREWMRALRRVYGYEPVVYTTAGPGQDLNNGLPFCRVKSWLTGRRLVSLPFSDHCEPLIDTGDSLQELLSEVTGEARRDGLKYVEMRPLSDGSVLGESEGFSESDRYYMHFIDISDDVDAVFSRLHKNAVKLLIRQAERECLTYDQVTPESQLKEFHDLLLVMRRKHSIPPQPLEWFQCLSDCFGDALEVRTARKDGTAIASIITILHKGVIYYKYMGYDPQTIKSGGIPALVWRAIVELKDRGATRLDFGRTDLDNESLVVYKDRWAAQRSTMTYYRYPHVSEAGQEHDGKLGLAKLAFAHMPNCFLKLAGKMLYKHIG